MIERCSYVYAVVSESHFGLVVLEPSGFCLGTKMSVEEVDDIADVILEGSQVAVTTVWYHQRRRLGVGGG